MIAGADRYHRRVAEPTTETQLLETSSTLSTRTTLIGPNGTAPGMTFVEQQQQPVLDAQTGRAAGAPLAVAAVILLVIFTMIVIRAARSKRRASTPEA
jgi:hypothetical protein